MYETPTRLICGIWRTLSRHAVYRTRFPRTQELTALLWLLCALATMGIASAAWNETVLYSFTGGADGGHPEAGLILDAAGNLYGTTAGGGAANAGVVFKLDTAGREMVLYSFTGGADGNGPNSGVIRDAAGNLYGTTSIGGNLSTCHLAGCGVVFKLDTTGKETVLYSFTGGADGAGPEAGVMHDSAGNLYGTTYDGGASGFGVVYKVDTASQETVLHNFTGGPDGRNPLAGVILDPAGNLYGTTGGGGANTGSVYKVDAAGQETVLHHFTGHGDGNSPSGGVVRDPAGHLYGATYYGGASGFGVVFELPDTGGPGRVLYSFTGGVDGGNPYSGVIRDSAGNLYGTTWKGGTANVGVVFKLTPQ